MAVVLLCSPALANEEAADSTNADQLWAGGGLGLSLTGAGVTVGIWEAGSSGSWEVRSTHETFASYNPVSGLWDGPSRVTFGDTPTAQNDNHATHVAGTIGGAHIPGNESRWGMAPGVQIVSFSAGSDNNEMEEETGIDISNHSYGINPSPWDERDWNVSDGAGGTVTKSYDTWSFDWDTTNEDPTYGAYNSSARGLDLTLNQRPKLLSFFSAGNARNDADDRYDDLQNDNKFVTRFSQNYINTTGVIGESLGSRYYLVSLNDYALNPHGFDPGGYDSLTSDKVAKNNVVVGAAVDFTADPHSSNGGSISTTSFSSYGPTDDGGLGVDLVANGNSLDSSIGTSDTSYGRYSGTSMSSPNAAGTAALILEHWRNENGGYTPDSATQKGLLMHTATDATAGAQIGPDYRTGYGMINAAEAVTHITEAIDDPLSIRDRHAWEDTLSSGEVISLDFVATGGFFKASISWLDLAASTSTSLDDRTSKLVNDLDIRVVDEFNNTYWTWVLDPENPANAATRDADNRVDNFTQVYIDSLVAGTELTVYIDHFGSLTGGDQDFAFFATGAVIAPTIPGDLDLDGDVDGVDISGFFVNFTGENNGPPGDPGADLDGDGDVDGVDISAAFVAYTGELAPAAVPEPTSLALLAPCGFFAVRRRRRIIR